MDPGGRMTDAPRTAAGRRVYAELDDEAWLADILAIEAEATASAGGRSTEAAAPSGDRLRSALEGLIPFVPNPRDMGGPGWQSRRRQAARKAINEARAALAATEAPDGE